MKDVWPAILVTGVSFAIPQFLISNFINPWIVDIGASLISMACLIGFLKIWQPKELWLSPALRTKDDSAKDAPPPSRRAQAAHRAGVARAAALDHRLRHPAALGHQLVQGTREPVGDLELRSS
jgi:lactate permease